MHRRMKLILSSPCLLNFTNYYFWFVFPFHLARESKKSMNILFFFNISLRAKWTFDFSRKEIVQPNQVCNLSTCLVLFLPDLILLIDFYICIFCYFLFEHFEWLNETAVEYLCFLYWTSTLDCIGAMHLRSLKCIQSNAYKCSTLLSIMLGALLHYASVHWAGI